MDDSLRLSHVLEALPAKKILVIGDLILDRYVDGKAGRVLPEAPVLVFEWENERYLQIGRAHV